MRLRPWVAVVLIASILLCGCAGNQEVPETTTMAVTEATIVEPETVDTEPATLPPARPPEEVLPEIETLVADTPNARVYIEDGTLCVETCDETTTGTGSVAYDRFDGAADAWQKVIDNSVALCLLMRTKMDDEGVTNTPAKVVITDERFSTPILTVVDGKVTEDTVAIGLAKNPTMLPNAPYGSNGKSTVGSASHGQMVWIPTNGGDKYHTSASAHNMKNPENVSEAEAIRRGFGRCKICFG